MLIDISQSPIKRFSRMHHIHRNNFLWHVRERDTEDDHEAEKLRELRETQEQHWTEQVRTEGRGAVLCCAVLETHPIATTIGHWLFIGSSGSTRPEGPVLC